MITIISQPPVDRLMSAYRPVISTVDFTDNIVPVYFNVTVVGGVASLVYEDDAIFAAGPTTITFGNAPGLNGTYNIFVIGVINPGHNITVQATVPFVDGSYPQATIALNGVPVLNAVNSGAPKATYCDIYIQGVYYKTVAKTQPLSRLSNVSRFEFDIQNALQEYITKYLPTNGGGAIETDVLNQVYCKFRSSTFDVNGFLVPDGPVPVQGTSSTPPTGGGGTQGNNFFAVNATLQHEDNQDLETHLGYFKYTGLWGAGCNPLTHRPDTYRICRTDNDWFPVVIKGRTPGCIKLHTFDAANVETLHNYCPPDPIVLEDLIFKWNRLAGDSVDISGVINNDFGTVDWGDGTVNNLLTHTYAAAGNFTVTVETNSSICYFIDGLDFMGSFNLTEIVQFISTITKVIVNPTFGSPMQVTTFPAVALMTGLLEFHCNSNALTAIPNFSTNLLLNVLNIGITTAISGVVNISANHALTKIILNIPNMTGVTADYGVCEYFEAINCKLSTASVNTILQGLDANAIALVTAKCYLYGQTPAAPPSGAGAISKANLITKFWTVITD